TEPEPPPPTATEQQPAVVAANRQEQLPQPPARPVPAPPESVWWAFSLGCWLMQSGLAVEFLVLLASALLAASRTIDHLGEVPGRQSDTLTALFLMPLLLGTGLVVFGRIAVTNRPAGFGGLGWLIDASVWGVLRVGALIGVALFVLSVLTSGQRPFAQRGELRETADLLLLLASLTGLLADFCGAFGMAAVARRLTDERFRRRADLAVVVMKVVCGLVLLILLALSFALAPEDQERTVPPTKPRKPASTPVHPDVTAFAFLGAVAVVYAIQIGYFFLNYSLYALGRRPARTSAAVGSAPPPTI
ncbi:MAG: hypothetical protein K2V38_11760, partial [Gemmataceae bacterium]|nr:hypothetical protein [Gemmataceae bacterium]